MGELTAFDAIDGVRVGIIGDFCLDIYWTADMTKSELSRETPHYPLPVVGERIYPGAAGNLAANVAALCPASVGCCGVIGTDWRAEVLLRELQNRGINADGLVSEQGRFTNAYVKPLRCGISETVYEDPRLDFANYSPISAESEKKLLNWLDGAAEKLDILLVCDQFEYGAITPAVRKKITQLCEGGLRVAVDSRNNIARFRGGWLKPNQTECIRALGIPEPSDIDGYAAAARELAQKCGANVLLTLGEDGCVVCCGGGTQHIPAVACEGEKDICGAGDTFLSAFGSALAAGAQPADAARFAGRASAVTIRKIGMTGTATRGEIASV